MSDGGTFLQLSLSIRFSSNAGDTARWGLLPEVCKCVNAVALEMRRWAALCVCVCVRAYVCVYVLLFFFFFFFFFFFPPLPSSCALFHLLAFAYFSQSWSSVCQPALCCSLSQSEGKKKRSQMAKCGCGWSCCWWRLNATVYTSQLPPRSRLNSVKPLCLHAPFHCNLNVLNAVA